MLTFFIETHKTGVVCCRWAADRIEIRHRVGGRLEWGLIIRIGNFSSEVCNCKDVAVCVHIR